MGVTEYEQPLQKKLTEQFEDDELFDQLFRKEMRNPHSNVHLLDQYVNLKNNPNEVVQFMSLEKELLNFPEISPTEKFTYDHLKHEFEHLISVPAKNPQELIGLSGILTYENRNKLRDVHKIEEMRTAVRTAATEALFSHPEQLTSTQKVKETLSFSNYLKHLDQNIADPKIKVRYLRNQISNNPENQVMFRAYQE